MSRASNTFKASDISTTPIKIKYSGSMGYGTDDISFIIGRNRLVGQNDTVDTETLNYRFLKQLYYNNYLSGSVLQTTSSWDSNMQSTACYGSDEYEYRYFPTHEDATVIAFSIPPYKFGEQISRNSVRLKFENNGGAILVDDGNGNLVVDGSFPPTHIGNIIYSQGIAIITEYSSIPICAQRYSQGYLIGIDNSSSNTTISYLEFTGMGDYYNIPPGESGIFWYKSGLWVNDSAVFGIVFTAPTTVDLFITFTDAGGNEQYFSLPAGNINVELDPFVVSTSIPSRVTIVDN
jgi:hypothetical protein